MNLRLASSAFLAAIASTATASAGGRMATSSTRALSPRSAAAAAVASSSSRARRRRASSSSSSTSAFVAPPPHRRRAVRPVPAPRSARPSSSASSSAAVGASSSGVYPGGDAVATMAGMGEEEEERGGGGGADLNLKSSFLTTMRDRGFLHQCTDLVALDDILRDAEEASRSSSTAVVDDGGGDGGRGGGGVVSAYLGFDATADSLHVGSLLQIMILRHLQKCGHRPIVLVGGGTSKVGDPTGKDESRMLLADDVIAKNTEGISRVFRKFLTFGPAAEEGEGGGEEGDDDDGGGGGRGGGETGHRRPNDAIMVNNDTWLSSLGYLKFLRDYGTHFTINRMLGFESVRQRLNREAPFTFLEFNYMILQAYDFLELSRRHGAVLQLGGSDQWGNMISGVELGRRVDSKRLYALTAPLITTSDGKKMGKTAGGAVWLNADKLSEYDYWQFWRNTDDSDVIRFLKLFTELPLEEIRTMEGWTGSDVDKAKIVLADEATALLHGRECLVGIRETADGMFGGGGGGVGGVGGEGSSTEGLNRVYVSEDDVARNGGGGGGGGGDDVSLGGGVRIADLLVRLGLATSKKDAKRLISGGGARLGETKVTDENAILDMGSFVDGSREVTLRAGKKRAGVVELSSK